MVMVCGLMGIACLIGYLARDGDDSIEAFMGLLEAVLGVDGDSLKFGAEASEARPEIGELEAEGLKVSGLLRLLEPAVLGQQLQGVLIGGTSGGEDAIAESDGVSALDQVG